MAAPILSDIVGKLKAELDRLSDKKIAAHSKRFFKTGKGEYAEGDKFLGIRVPALRKLVKKYCGLSVDNAAQLLKSEFHEERLLALLVLTEIFMKADNSDRDKIYKLYLKNTRHINNWDLIDLSAPHIVGRYLQDRDRSQLYSLALSVSLWERRIAVMATLHFIRRNDFNDTLNIAKILLNDRHDLVHKAAGWMLREIGKRDLTTAEDFLNKHCLDMPRTMLRYAIENFPEDKRKSYLRRDVKRKK